jgi:hypothetical protein
MHQAWKQSRKDGKCDAMMLRAEKCSENEGNKAKRDLITQISFLKKVANISFPPRKLEEL